MVRSPTTIKYLAVVLVLGLALAGCAAMERSEAYDTEQLLAAAGFKMRPADTPAKLAHLNTLTQRTLVSHERNGKMYYVYADAEYCRCLYAGNQENYQRYQSLSVTQNRAKMNEAESMNWRLWGPWEPVW